MRSEIKTPGSIVLLIAYMQAAVSWDDEKLDRANGRDATIVEM